MRALGRMGREIDHKLNERRTTNGNGILSEMLETDNAGWFSGMGDHRGNLLLPAGASCLACRSQSNDLPALRKHLAVIEDEPNKSVATTFHPPRTAGEARVAARSERQGEEETHLRAANGSQPIRSEANQTSSAAGSRR